MVRFHVRIMIIYIVFILSVIFVIGFVGFSSKPSPIMGVRVNCEWWGGMWYCVEFWWVFFRFNSFLIYLGV